MGPDGRYMAVVVCMAALSLRHCDAFVHSPRLHCTQLRVTQHQASTPASTRRPALSALRMAKKSAGGSKRKKKKAAASEGTEPASVVGGTSLADPAEPAVLPAALEDFEDAGGSMMGGGFGAKPAPGALLEEGAVGTDAAREAKIEDTLRKMGIKGAQDIAKENQKSVGEKITSIFDLIPAETQLLMEKVFIGGFLLCLTFLVVCGGAIGVDAYYMSTKGVLPAGLDDFIIHYLQPFLTPSLIATFAFSSALGILKLGQMGQESVVYKEDD